MTPPLYTLLCTHAMSRQCPKGSDQCNAWSMLHQAVLITAFYQSPAIFLAHAYMSSALSAQMKLAPGLLVAALCCTSCVAQAPKTVDNSPKASLTDCICWEHGASTVAMATGQSVYPYAFWRPRRTWCRWLHSQLSRWLHSQHSQLSDPLVGAVVTFPTFPMFVSLSKENIQ